MIETPSRKTAPSLPSVSQASGEGSASRESGGHAAATLPGFRQAFGLAGPQLESVEERIRQQARQFDPAVEAYVDYVCDTGGKRLRPVLALLSAGATGSVSPKHLDLAVIIELIHIATLVHDDIMDGAEVRREQPTANAKWGNAITVLLGDALFAHALRLATGFENSEICRRIADASVEVCSGEIVQTQRRFDLKLSLPDYFKIIEMKTAALFSAACELSGLLNGSSPEIVSALRIFGLKLGTAYQIYDDVVDLVGTEEAAGKTLGTDLRKGKFTLPILMLLQQAESPVSRRVKELILSEGEPGTESDLVGLMRESESLRDSCETADRVLDEAAAALEALPPSEYRDCLAAIALHVRSLVADLVHGAPRPSNG